MAALSTTGCGIRFTLHFPHSSFGVSASPFPPEVLARWILKPQSRSCLRLRAVFQVQIPKNHKVLPQTQRLKWHRRLRRVFLSELVPPLSFVAQSRAGQSPETELPRERNRRNA